MRGSSLARVLGRWSLSRRKSRRISQSVSKVSVGSGFVGVEEMGLRYPNVRREDESGMVMSVRAEWIIRNQFLA